MHEFFVRYRMELFTKYFTLALTWLLSNILVPCSGGSVYFIDTQVVATEGKQFNLRVGHSGTINGIVNVIVSVSYFNV